MRDQANRALDVYLLRVRKFSQTLPDTVQPRPTNPTADATNGSPRPGTPSTDSSTWGGWALSSFTSKFNVASVEGEIEPRTSTPNGQASNGTQPGGYVPPIPAQSKPIVRSAPTTRLTESYTAPNEDEHDNPWGEMGEDVPADAAEAEDAWGSMADDDDSQLPTSTANIRPTPMPQSNKNTTNKFIDDGEPDFAGWLKAQQSSAKTQKTPLPKGLPPKTIPVIRTINASRPAPTASKSASITKTTVANPVKAPMKKQEPDSVQDDEAWGDAWE